jgi:hypothetical protein
MVVSARWLIFVSLIVAVILSVQHCHARQATNGFAIKNPLVPAEQIYHGGPPRDGIPAIDQPRFITAKQAGFLKPDDRVLGIYFNGVAKVYAVRILNYHEIVNDVVANQAVVISFCPLCGTGMAFKAEVAGVNLQFGVSGLLYNSDMLLYDRQTESLWSQIMKQAISGPMKGRRLEQLPLSHTTWQDWRQQYPGTLVLSTQTGYSRDYSRTPYPGYTKSDYIMFPVNYKAAQYHPKELVIGLEIDQAFKAYPFTELDKSGKVEIMDSVANKPVKIVFDAVNRTGKIFDHNNNEIPTIISFWFAWMAFHPNSEVYSAVANSRGNVR